MHLTKVQLGIVREADKRQISSKGASRLMVQPFRLTKG